MASPTAIKRAADADEEANMNAPVRARTSSSTLPTQRKERRDYSLPTTTLAQLPLLEIAIAAGVQGQGLPDVILNLVGGRVPARKPTVLPLDPSQALGVKDQLTGQPFVDAFKRQADVKTAKGGAAFASSGTALVDLDFALKPPGDVAEIRELLAAAYQEDPLATVKIIFRARSIHEGKGFREGLWIAAGWLMEHHPVTLLENLHLLVDPTCERHRSKARDAARSADTANANEDENMGVETCDEKGSIESNVAELPQYPARPHGTWDDLNDLVMLALNGQLNGTYEGSPTAPEKIAAPEKGHGVFKQDRERRKIQETAERDRRGFKKFGVMAARVKEGSFGWKLLKAGSKQAKGDLYEQRLFHALTHDKKFQALYLTVVFLFVKQLETDLVLLNQHTSFLSKPLEERKPFGKTSSPHLFAMSLAAKWVASPGHSADKQTYLASAIGHLLFPGDGFNLARTHLQQRYLAPLRAALSVPEVQMKKGEWKIDYSKVPGRCMARNSGNFMAHDPAGFEAYLKKVASGTLSISGASLLPHEIVMDVCGSKLDNCIAIADVSGSMGSYLSGDKKQPQPINVCIALTLLLGEVAMDPWRGMFFTFSEVPSAEFVDVSLPLRERAIALQSANWGQSTNFHTVFELILRKAQEEQLAPDSMVRKLFVFSDMQFDAAGGKQQGETEYAAVRRKFQNAGYQMPELVFWNLNAGERTPVPVKGDQEGVSLMSGLSAAQIKYFLGGKDDGDDEWVKDEMDVLSEDGEGVEVKKEMEGGEQGESKKERKQDSPFDTLRKVLDAESLRGVVIYD